jgi:NAD(P)-dependent dehydrogenase (short-subunit alcohol dehydrogenase family)
VTAEINRSNVHIIQGDLDIYELLKVGLRTSSQETILIDLQRKQAKPPRRSLAEALTILLPTELVFPKVLISLALGTCMCPFSILLHNCYAAALLNANESRGKDPVALEEELMAGCKTNVVGNVHLFNLFLPLVLKGQQKKIIAISSGNADLDLINNYEIEVNGPYSVGKAATNAVVAKFGAEYAKDGVLFMSICPGMVDTGHFDPAKCKLLNFYFSFETRMREGRS